MDVLAERRFCGNQVAVFPDARGLRDDEMQAIVRELNFPESTFVLPPDDPAHTARVRTFTPRTELPFAGHRTLGTAAVLTALGRGRAADGRTRLRLHIGQGVAFGRPSLIEAVAEKKDGQVRAVHVAEGTFQVT